MIKKKNIFNCTVFSRKCTVFFGKLYVFFCKSVRFFQKALVTLELENQHDFAKMLIGPTVFLHKNRCMYDLFHMQFIPDEQIASQSVSVSVYQE